ncbi:MAG TPA: transglutaminase-like domain-containing protein [Gemmataceae bacterium]
MDLDTALDALARDPNAPFDLAELALQLAADEYPTLDVEAYLGELAGMAHEVKSYLRGSLEARVIGLCRYLFHDMGFRGNQEEYYDPRNSYFNQVLDRKTGLPIALSAVAMAVGTRAGLRVVGVGLPGHFLAKAVGKGKDILFDPFHGGRLLNVEECERLVQRVTKAPFEATPEAFHALPLGSILVRMLANLKGVYLREGDFVRAVRVIKRITQLVPDDLMQQRDLGVTLLNAGQPGGAIDLLNAYLAAVPKANDGDAIRQLIKRAKEEIARWN